MNNLDDLRDRFAEHAMHELLRTLSFDSVKDLEKNHVESVSAIVAFIAYAFADAMLAERAKEIMR